MGGDQMNNGRVMDVVTTAPPPVAALPVSPPAATPIAVPLAAEPVAITAPLPIEVAQPELQMEPVRRPVSIAMKVAWGVTGLLNAAALGLLIAALLSAPGAFGILIATLALVLFAPLVVGLTVVNLVVLIVSIIYLVRREKAYKAHRATFEIKKV